MKLAVLTPSRSRPQRFAEMVEAISSTADTEVDVYLATDSDDEFYPYIEGVSSVRGPRQTCATWTNELAELALVEGADVLAFFGDDHRPRTQGWDTKVFEALDEEGPGLVYAADGLQNARLPTAPFWSASIIRELGWFFPPGLKHMYADNYWLRLANDLNRCIYLPNVLIEHMHPSIGKAEMDEVYEQNDAHYSDDEAAFRALVTSDDYRDSVEKVKKTL